MKMRLILFLILFPACLWVFEYFLRWALDDHDTNKFIYPAVASTAMGMIGPVSVPRPTPYFDRGRDDAICYAGLIFLVPGLIAWFLCVAIGIRNKVPDALSMMSPLSWQFALAMGLYVVASILTLAKEA